MIKRTQPGLSLFECLLYIGMFVFVITQLFQYVVSTQQQIKKFSRTANASLGWLIAQDILVRDLVAAPADQECWVTLTATELLWVCPDGSACNWALKKGNIIRTSGKYDVQSKDWQKSTKSTVAENITQFTITSSAGAAGVKHIAIIWAGLNDAGGQQTMQMNVALRNRKLL